MTSDAEIVERLNFENNEIEHELGWAKAELTRLSARVEELERGLKPFASAALFLNGIAAKTPLMLPSYVDVEDHEVDATVGDLRTARSLLSPSTNLKE